MSGVPWHDLMRLGLCELRLDPETFWAMTPTELMLMAGSERESGFVLSRSGLDDLMTRFPDQKTDKKEER